jgi:hypothetical protein
VGLVLASSNEALVRPFAPTAAARTARATLLFWPIVFGLLFASLNAFSSLYLYWDGYLDLTGGRYVAEHGIPRTEALTSEAAGRPWISQQWLAHLAYYEIWKVGGYAGVAAASSLSVGLAFGLLGALMLRLGAGVPGAAAWLAGAYVLCLGQNVIRAQTLAFPLFVVLLWLVVADRRRWLQRRAVAMIGLPVLVLWANIHGSALLGAGIFASYWLAASWLSRTSGIRTRAQCTALAAASAASVLATPYGLSIREYYAALVGNPVVAEYIIEWQPPDLGKVGGIGFLLFLVAVVASVAVAAGRGVRPSPELVAVAAAAAAITAHGWRYQAWFGLSGALAGAATVAALNARPGRPTRAGYALGAIAAATAVLWAGSTLLTRTDAEYEAKAPVRAMALAAELAARDPALRVLADEHTSSALLWKHPALAGRVGFDARLEQYAHEDLEAWLRFITARGPGWSAVAARYDLLVVARETTALVDNVHLLRGWRLVYADAEGLLLERRQSVTHGLGRATRNGSGTHPSDSGRSGAVSG